MKFRRYQVLRNGTVVAIFKDGGGFGLFVDRPFDLEELKRKLIWMKNNKVNSDEIEIAIKKIEEKTIIYEKVRNDTNIRTNERNTNWSIKRILSKLVPNKIKNFDNTK